MAIIQSESDHQKPNVNEASLGLLAALRKAGVQAFKPIGFTPIEAMLLVFVERGVTKPTDLTRLLGLVFPGLSTMASKMVEAGFLTKSAVNVDHRQVCLQLTAQGEHVCQEIKAAWAVHSPIDTSGFTDEEISAWIRISEKLLQQTGR